MYAQSLGLNYCVTFNLPIFYCKRAFGERLVTNNGAYMVNSTKKDYSILINVLRGRQIKPRNLRGRNIQFYISNS